MSETLETFDGADEFRRSWRRGLAPDASLTVSQWADEHRYLSPREGNESGKYRTGRTPYMRAIMDALSPSHPARRVVFMKSGQVGATMAGVNWAGYVIHHSPGPMMAVQPTVELGKRFSRQRIDSMIESCPALKERVKSPRARDSGNTMLSKEFPAGMLIITGANSAVGLRSMSARYLFLDEVDAYEPSAGDEGDPIALAMRATFTFSSRSKVFIASTPRTHGSSRIEREYEESDQQRLFVPCPHCGEPQWLKFERLRWEKGKPNTVHYLCEACEGRIDERHKAGWAFDDWRPTSVSEDPGTIGFHISALYSPIGWLSWAEIARMWGAAKTDEQKKVFKNIVLGEAWVDSGEAPDWERLYERRDSSWRYGTVPAGGLFLTAGVDVQKDRIEVSIWAWGRGLTSWLVEHVVIDGKPEAQETWAELSALLSRTWQHENGARLGLTKLAIDTGYETAAVYAWARRSGVSQVIPIKGVEGFNRAAPVAGPTYVEATDKGRKIKRGVRLWTIAVATFKSETYRFLRLSRPTDEEAADGAASPPGFVHLPQGTGAEWVKQLVAEQLVSVKTKKGFQRLEWRQMRERNEALDCRVYARAAAWIAGADRWTEDKWRVLEEAVAEREIMQTVPEHVGPPPYARPPSPGGWLDVGPNWL